MSLRRWLPNVLLAAASLAIFAGGAELLAHAIDLRPAGGTALANPPWLGDRVLLRDDYRDEMAKAGVLARYYELYEWDRFLFYRLRPHVNTELLDVFAPPRALERSRWSVHTNSRGFRTPEFADTKAAGVVPWLAYGTRSRATPSSPAMAFAGYSKLRPKDECKISLASTGVPAAA